MNAKALRRKALKKLRGAWDHAVGFGHGDLDVMRILSGAMDRVDNAARMAGARGMRGRTVRRAS